MQILAIDIVSSVKYSACNQQLVTAYFITDSFKAVEFSKKDYVQFLEFCLSK